MKSLDTQIKEDLKKRGHDWNTTPERVKELLRMMYSGEVQISEVKEAMRIKLMERLVRGRK